MKKTMIALALVMAVTTSVIFANGQKETASSSSEELVLNFATNAEYPPMEFIDDDGNMTGFDIDLLNHIGTELGYTINIKNVAWDGIFAGLANGAYQGVAAGITVTDERKQALEFTNTYLEVTQAFISRSDDSQNKATTAADCEGKTVGVLMGSTSDIYLQDSGVDMEIKGYDDIASAVEDMLNGNTSIVVTDSVVAAEYVLKNESFKGKLTITGNDKSTSQPMAMCFQKGDTKNVELINGALAKMEEDGSLQALKEKWSLL